MNYTDWELLKQNNDSAFKTLFDRHKSYVFRLAVGMTNNRHLSDDITQEVFLRVYKQRFKLKKKAEFKTVLYRMTINTSHEFIRSEAKVTNLNLRLKTDTLDERHINDDKRLNEVLTIIQHLSERQREIVLLRFFEKQSIKEVAETLLCSEGNIKSQIHLAIKKLRQLFTARRNHNDETR